MPDDHPTQPHLVQLGAVLLDEWNSEVDSLDVLIRPQGWTIPARATELHGITTEQAMAEGIPEAEAVGRLLSLAARAKTKVAHNAVFDLRVLRIAMVRMFKGWSQLPTVCTMEATRNVCQLPPTQAMLAAGRTEYKNPRLNEAYWHLLHEEMPGPAHNALVDARASAAIYRELAGLGELP